MVCQVGLRFVDSYYRLFLQLGRMHFVSGMSWQINSRAHLLKIPGKPKIHYACLIRSLRGRHKHSKRSHVRKLCLPIDKASLQGLESRLSTLLTLLHIPQSPGYARPRSPEPVESVIHRRNPVDQHSQTMRSLSRSESATETIGIFDARCKSSKVSDLQVPPSTICS